MTDLTLWNNYTDTVIFLRKLNKMDDMPIPASRGMFDEQPIGNTSKLMLDEYPPGNFYIIHRLRSI